MIILFEQKSLAKKGFSTKDLLENEKAASYSSSLKKQQLSLVDRIEREALGGEKLEIRYQFTVAVNGVATVVPWQDRADPCRGRRGGCLPGGTLRAR